MATYSVELYGTITRDIIWFDVDAADEAEARRIVAQERPSYRINKITLASGNSDTGAQHNQYGCVVGMTLRDYFAAQAIRTMIHLSQDADGGWSVENVANGCYNLADAMLAARDKPTP